MSKYYDGRGNRVPSPRDDDGGITTATVVAAICILLSIVMTVAYVRTKAALDAKVTEEREAVKAEAERQKELTRLTSQDSMSEIVTDDGHRIRLYVETDPDTGRQYVIAHSDEGGVGICERPTHEG